MISATLRSCGSSPFESSWTSCPSALRFTEALKVANLNESPSRARAGAAALSESVAAAASAAALRVMEVTMSPFRVWRRETLGDSVLSDVNQWETCGDGYGANSP